MSEKFQSCPGCESLILAETAACPECGHTFQEGATGPADPSLQRSATLHQTCPKCGDDVPSGLVRCWSCNAFMREDVAKKYQTLVDNPQKIIFSDVPPDERTETIPARGLAQQGGYARINDQGEAEFVLDGEESDFQLSGRTDSAEARVSKAPESTAASEVPTESKEEPKPSLGAQPASAESASASPQAPEARSGDETRSSPKVNADNLLDIALTQEKEASFRKRERLAALNQKRIMVPCPSCGVWLKVREDQSGRSVRCRQCKTAIPIPEIRKKEPKAKKVDRPGVVIDWIDDVHMHLVVPTEIALKPGSLKDTIDHADLAFNDEGLHFIRMGDAAPKKSLFSRKVVNDFTLQRSENRERIQETGNFTKLPHGETHTIPVENLTAIRLVQPIKKAHESMFAGVSVFGEGRIAVYLPLRLTDDKQAFCSMPISVWRQFAYHLKNRFDIELPTTENGVPAKDVHSSPACHYSQAKLESLRNVEYYENDDAYELELTGYRCTACGISVSEAARAKNKLGGAAGKSIAKAKCPACSAKFGREPLYRVTRAPEPLEVEDPENNPVPAASSDATGS
jgi:DNA-directed RNA polymerase subunit M/transcription elongation factor TFIIS